MKNNILPFDATPSVSLSMPLRVLGSAVYDYTKDSVDIVSQ